MSSTVAFIASFIAILLGAAGGLLLGRHSYVQALETGTRDSMRLGAGFLATLAALVIGLMIASAKNSYDGQNTNIRQLAANAALADQMLGKYGPEANTARALLREAIPYTIARIWHENRSNAAGLTFVVGETGERFYNAIESLKPGDEEQRSLKSRLVQITADIARTRFLVFTQADNAIPAPFFIVLMFWLAVIFGSFCLFAELNRLMIATVLIFALSVSSALFLIVDLSRPFEGLMQIPDRQLRVVLPTLDK